MSRQRLGWTGAKPVESRLTTKSCGSSSNKLIIDDAKVMTCDLKLSSFALAISNFSRRSRRIFLSQTQVLLFNSVKT